MPEQTDAERRRDIEDMLGVINKAGAWLQRTGGRFN
jgi:hypothetical protein